MHYPHKYFVERVLTSDELRTYNEQGYLALGRLLTDGGLDAMRQQCMAAWTAEKGEFDPEKTWLQNALLTNIHQRSEVAREFYFDGPLVDIAEQLIGPNIKGVASQLTFKMRGNTKDFGWHQDNGYGELDPYNSLTTLTALDDTDEQNGCLWIIPGSHKMGQINVGHTLEDKQAEKSIDVEADRSRAVPIHMKAGDSVVFHCWTLHMSEGNLSKDRDRRILFLRYADADAVEVYNACKPRLGRLLRGRTKFSQVETYEASLCVS